MADQALRHELAARLRQFFSDASDGRNGGAQGAMAVGSIQGPYRDRNEDRAAVVQFKYSSPPALNLRLAVLCDGMGGLKSGDEIAARALSAFITSIALTSERSVREMLVEACAVANNAVFSRFNGGGGTTLTAIALTEKEAKAIHVGDSRLYSIRKDGVLELISRDDTISGVVNSQYTNYNEDDLDNRLIQFVGIGDTLQPHVISLDRASTDLWILTSDGAHGLGRNALEGIIRRIRGPVDLVRKIIFVSDALSVKDNATVACMNTILEEYSPNTISGRSLSLWSPSQNLEIWLPSDAEAREELAASSNPKSSPGAVRNKNKTQPAGPLNRKTSQKSPKKPKVSTNTIDESLLGEKSEPPMEVLFRRGDEND